MKNHKGFIATSLIYSFFLVFIAIMAALINNYVANKTILLRYNENLEDQKNKETFSFKLVTKGSENFKISYNDKLEEIIDIKGRTLTNLIQDSNFSNNEGRWVQNGNISFTPNNLYNSKMGLMVKEASSSSSIHQENIMSIYNNNYYFSIEYASNYPRLIEATFLNTPSFVMEFPSNNLSWKRLGMTYREMNETIGPYNKFYLRGSNTIDTNYNSLDSSEAHFTNAMLINLTAHYDPGREPNADWMNANIEYFDGTINYIIDSFIEKNEEIIIKMYTTQTDFSKINNLSCNGLKNDWSSGGNVEVEIEQDATGKYFGFLRIKNISDDIECSLEWGI